MSESEQNTRENIRVCREEKQAPCELCIREYSTKSHAVYLCVQCCIYYCDKHKHCHSRPMTTNKKHTEIAFNVTKEVRNRNFKLYLEELKRDNLDTEFDERKISLSGLIDVRHESRDSEKCWITGIVLLDDGRLTLVDQNNYCIKFLDLESQKITYYMHIPFKPRYLSEYEIGKGVVTCPDNKRLFLIDLNTRSIIKVIHLDGVSLCVGSLRDMFIVSFTDKIQDREYFIQIINRDGKVLTPLLSGISNPVQSEPYPPISIISEPYHHLVVDKDRELFYILDPRRSAVFCFNLTGTMLNRYKHEQLMCSQAMTIGPDGDVYVAGILSRNVHKLSPLLKKSQIIMDKSDSLDEMWCIPSDVCISRSQTLYANHPYNSPASNYISIYKEE